MNADDRLSAQKRYPMRDLVSKVTFKNCSEQMLKALEQSGMTPSKVLVANQKR